MVWYHGTTEENWQKIQEEGILFGRRYIVDNDGNIIKEVDRCTYLAADKEEAECYGTIVLEVEYNPFDKNCSIRKDKRNMPLNNYIDDCWQLRVYEPISIKNIKRIK